MVTFKLIQLYPGSKPLGYILKPVNNGLTKPDNYYQNGIWFNPSDYPEFWQEIKQLSLLEEAKLRYPIGTKFRSVQYDSGVKISNNNIYEETYIHLPIIYCNGTTIYYNDQWAEIVDDFVLPEKWCIKQNISKEVCDWFNKNGTTFANIHGSWTYLNYPYIEGYYSSEIKSGCTEITFEQFKKYVLKEETTVKVKEKVVEKDYEILEYKTESGISCKAPFLSDSHQFYIDERCKIYSIKRISDNSIFTIGDDVLSKTCSVPNKILSIELINNKIRLYPRNSFYNLNDIEKFKQPLFTTEDGVDIFEGDTFYIVDNWIPIIYENYVSINEYIHNLKFSTKEKAEEYILMNKPCLSLTDVWDNLKIKDQKEVMKFVKSKLNK